MDKLKVRMYKKNYALNNQDTIKEAQKDMFSLIGVKQLDITYPTKRIPVNTDKNKSRKHAKIA
jgi:hypothetical protein